MIWQAGLDWATNREFSGRPEPAIFQGITDINNIDEAPRDPLSRFDPILVTNLHLISVSLRKRILF